MTKTIEKCSGITFKIRVGSDSKKIRTYNVTEPPKKFGGFKYSKITAKKVV